MHIEIKSISPHIKYTVPLQVINNQIIYEGILEVHHHVARLLLVQRTLPLSFV